MKMAKASNADMEMALKLCSTLEPHPDAVASEADAKRYRWLRANARTTAEHWSGRWSLVIDGPAPMRNGCADALDEAVDAAMARAGREMLALCSEPQVTRAESASQPRPAT